MKTSFMPGLRALTLLLAALAGPSSAQTGTVNTGQRSLQVLMQEMGRAFRAAEQGIAQAGTPDLLRHAEALAELGRELSVLGSRAIPAPPGPFGQAAERSRDLAEELARKVAGDDTRSSRFAIDELRRACVSCHAVARPSEFVAFPAQRGAVTGTISLSDSNGDPKADRSDIIVFLDEGEKRFYPPPRRNPVVSQIDKSFSPRVLPVLVGTTVDFPNDDTIFHNAFSLSATKTFDLDVYEPGTTKSVTFTEAGVVRTYCNIHPNMNCSILVLNNPYFTMTDQDGGFTLPEIPDGVYLLRTWNEFGASSTQTITVEGPSLQRVEIAITETYRTLTHLNKFGKRYRGKYR